MKYIAHRSYYIACICDTLLQALLEDTEMAVSRALAHLQFFYTLEASFLRKGCMLLKCLPPKSVDCMQKEVSFNNFKNCAGCGLLFDAQALEAISLPCCHVYHLSCYVHVCREHSCCVAGDCKQQIPLRAKIMVGYNPTSAQKETTTGRFKINCTWYLFLHLHRSSFILYNFLKL